MKISGFVTAVLVTAHWTTTTTTTYAENSYLRQSSSPPRHATAVDGGNDDDYDKNKSSSNHEHDALSDLVVSSHGGNFYARLEVFPVQDCAAAAAGAGGEGRAVAGLVAGGKRRHYSSSVVAKAFVGAYNQDNNDYKITSFTVTREEDEEEEEDEGPFVTEAFLPDDLSDEDEAPSFPLASFGSAGKKKKGRKYWVSGSYNCRLCGRKPVMTATTTEGGGGQQDAAVAADVVALKGTGEYLQILNDMCKKVVKRGGCEYRSVKRCKASWTYRPYGSLSEQEQELDAEMILAKDYWHDEVIMEK